MGVQQGGGAGEGGYPGRGRDKQEKAGMREGLGGVSQQQQQQQQQGFSQQGFGQQGVAQQELSGHMESQGQQKVEEGAGALGPGRVPARLGLSGPSTSRQRSEAGE